MRSRNFWLVGWVIGGLLWVMVGCQNSGGVDEEARANMTTLSADIEAVQANLDNLNARSTDLAIQVAAIGATTEALVKVEAGSNEGSTVEATSNLLEMSLQVAIEVTHQDDQPGTFLPIDRLTFYKSLEEFGLDWTGDKNLKSQVKLAFLANDSVDAWQLYYTNDVISDTLAWSSPSWRRYLIAANWLPAAGSEAANVPATLEVDQGEKQSIIGQTAFLSSLIMLEGLQNLQAAITTSGGDLATANPIVFLVHDRSQGHDDLVLAIIDNAVAVGPDPNANSPVRQYCSRCQGYWCRWRCWRWRN